MLKFQLCYHFSLPKATSLQLINITISLQLTPITIMKRLPTYHDYNNINFDTAIIAYFDYHTILQ